MNCRMIGWFLAGALLAGWSTASAAMHEARVPLHDGRLRVGELSALLLDELHIPGIKLPEIGEIDVRGLSGNLFIHALNVSLGDGWHVIADDDALVLRCDPEKLPHTMTQTKRAARLFTAAAAPEATGNQNRSYGLLFPAGAPVANRPLVILIHGIDCDGSNWGPMVKLLSDARYQVGSFCYPADQPIEESAAMLQEHLAALRDAYPAMQLNLIGHSMGGLVARAYIEGEGYRGGVRRLIMIAPPNHGTPWVRLHPALELHEHYQLWKQDPDWRVSWMITDGLGEAGDELKCDSDFLKLLNSRPRRQGVQYTIIAGGENPLLSAGARWVERPAGWVPHRIENWWGIRQSRSTLQHWSEAIERRQGASDGPVAVASAKLDGVEDFVVLPADHTTLFYPAGDKPPAAWDTIRDRLGR